MKKTIYWRPYIVFAILSFILYGNTLNHFFALDDEVVLTKNVFTQKGIKGIPDIFKYDSFIGYILYIYDGTITAEESRREIAMVSGGRYRPLSLATFALEVQFSNKTNKYPNDSVDYSFKGNAFVSHLGNITYYLLTACLLFLILYRFFPPEKDRKWYLTFPFIVTLIFLSHPIHTEVVANIKGRDEIMALLGALAALWFTVKYFDTKRNYHLLLSGLCFFLGLLSKENTITFLAVIPITIYYFINKKTGRILKSMIPLFVASALFLWIRGVALGTNIHTPTEITDLMNNSFLNASKSETFATIFYTLLIYVKLLFFPHPLTWDYYPFHIEIVNWLNPITIISLLFYLGIIIYAIFGLLKKNDVISYSIWLFLLPLTIVANLFFSIGTFMGERFIYFSSIGFCVFIGGLIYAYFPKITKNNKGSFYLTSLALIIILCFFSVKTIYRNKAWKNDFTLFETDIQTSNNSAKGNYMLGNHLLLKALFPNDSHEIQRKGKYSKDAAKYLKRALEIYPGYIEAMEKLGNLYFDCYNDAALCLHYYAMALQKNTIRSENIYKMSIIVLDQTIFLLNEDRISSDISDILQSCDELLAIYPNFGEVYYTKGIIYGKYLNNIELSLVNFEKAASIDFPKTEQFYQDLGTIYGISAQYEKALSCMLTAIDLGIDSYITYMNLGVIYKELGDMKNANLYIAKGNAIKNKD